MKSIYTLATDVEELLKTKGWMSDNLEKEFGASVGSSVYTQFSTQSTPSLRLSRMGATCHKALWHSIHTPELAEPVQPWAQAKFSFGHFWEAYAIMLSKAAGHEVSHEQHECELLGVKGHIDAIVDGCLVDYKSCSSRQFQKYKANQLEGDDPFGYLEQLDGYVVACREQDFLNVKDRGYIIAVHRDLGHMHVYEHRIREASIRQRIAEYKGISERRNPPQCTCEVTSDGITGNIKLGTRASYSAYKWTCFPNLRCFINKRGQPVFYSKVIGRPYDAVREIDRYGNTIH